jgi:hypothetical protein
MFSLLKPSSRTAVLTQPLTEMTIRNLFGGKALSARKAGNLAVIWEPIV